MEKRTRFKGVVDTIVVDDPGLIHSLSEDPGVDRIFESRPLWNGWFFDRLLRVLSYRGERFPHLVPRDATGRKSRQDGWWELFTGRAGGMAEGPEDLQDLSRWIKGEGADVEPGILAQQVIGSFCSGQYRATGESWAAALTVSEASRSRNWPKMIWWRISGKVGRAKRLLEDMAQNDIIILHGTAVAVHNLAASVRKMKQLYADPVQRQTLTPEKAAELCLAPPPVVFRQATSEGKVGGCPFSKFSMFQFKLRDAYLSTGAKEMIFMSNGWSRCPAERWVPAVLAGIWKRACL